MKISNSKSKTSKWSKVIAKKKSRLKAKFKQGTIKKKKSSLMKQIIKRLIT